MTDTDTDGPDGSRLPTEVKNYPKSKQKRQLWRLIHSTATAIM